MTTITKTMSPEAIQTLYAKVKPLALRETKPQYTLWQLKTAEVTITAYQSGKVVFQGKDVSWLVDEEDTQKEASKRAKTNASKTSQFPQAGSDEVGTGDYLGPLVVAGAIVPDEKIAAQLEALHITDSKAMNDSFIRQVAPKIAKLLPYCVIVLSNERYNAIYNTQSMNLNKLKAQAHNQVYLRLQKKGYQIPELAVVDQFCTPQLYFSYLKDSKEVFRALHFETRAESKYPAVAAASVLARFAFLQAMDQLEKQYEMPFAKGGGQKATQSAQEFVNKYGKDQLKYVAKLHFINTTRLENEGHWSFKNPSLKKRAAKNRALF